MRLRYAGFGLLLVTAACVPMSNGAASGDARRRSRCWRANGQDEYESAALGRRGSIEFTLKAGTDDAYGEVLMVPRGAKAPYQPSPYYEGQAQPYMPASERPHDQIHPRVERFASRHARSVLGSRSAIATPCSTFDGRLEAGVVEGTFTTTFECGAGDASGTWKATKKSAKPSPARR